MQTYPKNTLVLNLNNESSTKTFKVVISQDTNLVENIYYFTYIKSDSVMDYKC